MTQRRCATFLQRNILAVLNIFIFLQSNEISVVDHDYLDVIRRSYLDLMKDLKYWEI